MRALSDGEPVFVSQRSGTAGKGVVERVRRDGRVVVRMDTTGIVRVVKQDHVMALTPQATAKLDTLTRGPDYSTPTLRPVAKPETERDPAYLAWLRTQPCAWSKAPAPSEASHHPRSGGGSIAAKCSDYRALPLSTECHAHFHQHGTLGSMTRDQFDAWVADEVTEHLARYVRHLRERKTA